MSAVENSLAFVVATKDRPGDLGRLLESLAGQTLRPGEIIIVDSGTERLSLEHLGRFTPGFIRYVDSDEASATKQRNLGLGLAGPEIRMIGFLDDDVILEPTSVERMMEFWRLCPGDVGGASFNLLNHPDLFAAELKSLPLAESLGLYSGTPGRVLPSGFQTMLGPMERTSFVEWLPSTACVWRNEVFSEFVFDEWFTGYSYLEDLDFSYRVARKYRLAVVADAGFYHFPGASGRGSGFQFGAREVRNRLHFVAKHRELSTLKCLLALKVRFAINLVLCVRERNPYYLQRAAGNLAGMSGWIVGTRRSTP